MLLQTNSYIVPKEKRSEHARLLRKFRQTLLRLGCGHFEVYEQVGANWSGAETTGRFVQIMRFRDRKHQQQIQAAERQDPVAQQLIAEFCALINFPYQQQQGLFAVGFYRSALPVASPRSAVAPAAGAASEGETASGAAAEAPAPPEVNGSEGASLLDIGSTPQAEARVDVPPEALPESSSVEPRVAPEAVETPEDDIVALDGLTFDGPGPLEQAPGDDDAESEPQAR